MNCVFPGPMRLKRLLFVLIFLMTCSLLLSQSVEQLVIGQQPVYKVSRAGEPVTVDGKMDEASWKNAEVRSFDYFYRGDKPADI